ncbi:MAG TPA: TIGR04086 family membrane protein [Clostridia bacterium]|nr:TIGR04086 family membrane protein [Clostridia bacterium]
MYSRTGVINVLKTSNSNTGAAANEKMSLFSILKGLMVSYVITIPAFMLFALILANTDFPQRLTTPAVVVTTLVSVLTAGAISTKGVRNRGWLNGSIVGLIYMIILYILSSLVYNDFAIDKYVVTMTIIGVLAGAIGGIVGINAKVTAKYKHA